MAVDKGVYLLVGVDAARHLPERLFDLLGARILRQVEDGVEICLRLKSRIVRLTTFVVTHRLTLAWLTK